MAEHSAKSGQAPVFRAGLGRLLPPGYLRVGPLASIPTLLSRFGADAAAVYRTAGVTDEAFEHPDNALPYKTVCRLVALSAEASRREDFGLLVSETVSPNSLGAIGFLMKYAPDVRTALEDFTRYCHHHDSGAVPFLRTGEGLATFGYAIMEASEPGSEIVYDGAIAIGCNLMRGLCGQAWQPLEVHLSRRPPRFPAAYERHFRVPVRFDAEQSAIIFEADWLDRPIPWSDPGLRLLLDEQLSTAEETETRLVEQVRRFMRVAILSRQGSLGDVAAALGMTMRTLERRLGEEGSQFRALSEEVRFEIARHLLVSTELSVTEIGLAVKYSEASAFSRAFKGWAGMPPLEWRRAHRRPSLSGEAGTSATPLEINPVSPPGSGRAD